MYEYSIHHMDLLDKQQKLIVPAMTRSFANRIHEIKTAVWIKACMLTI